ncbi:MliC family protein [Sphingomonas japonica]|uniref:Membrane-bound inhibitor of C-type lysozyme n=1 Tax=Sphingomonas japonica TaxID=511662 RepID=A0ABX0TYV1_9SPHN|nr:MliC family protein [Sphingomonas japonica]NIJ23424.1 membrane-bound inhibitor of C-type lysozyme [Sphingomonas japonica]
MRTIPIALAAVLLAGCGSDDPPDRGDTATIGLPEPADDASGEPAVATDTDASQPPPERDAAPGTARAAAEVARGYLDQVRTGDAVGALIAWDGDAAAADVAARRFAGLGSFAVDVGEPGPIAVGADERRVSVPFRATVADADADPVLGRVTLSRAGDSDGVARWRIRSVDFGDVRAQAAPPLEATAARYACADGSRIDAAFDNRAGTVTLTQGGQRIGVLAQQRAASGIWYRGDGAELRGKGSDATIRLPGDAPIECSAT